MTLKIAKTLEERIEDEINEIQLPLFDIVVNEDGSWFEKAIKEQEEEE